MLIFTENCIVLSFSKSTKKEKNQKMPFNMLNNHQIPKNPNLPKKEEKMRRLFFDVIVSILIRIVLLSQVWFSIYFMIVFYSDFTYLVLGLCLLVIIYDGFYVGIFRQGKEYTWYIQINIYVFLLFFSK